jgi:alcohol dehydrogenase class IV
MVGFVTAPSIVWGTGALEQLSGLGARRVVAIVEPAVASQEGPRRAVEELGRSGAAVVPLTDLAVSTRPEDVAVLASRLRAADPDWIVVVGGGTAIDAVKAARLLHERPGLVLDGPAVEVGLPSPPRTRLVAVPTTSGSGAEASWAVDLLRTDGSPFEIADRSLVPDWAIVDPLFARDLTTPALVAGAFESAALASEAYLSAWANPFSDALAVEALRTVVRRLPRAVRWSDDPDARAALHYAATQAGLAQSNAQRGLAHALARALVRPTGLAYAVLLGVVLPVVLDFDRPAARERLEALQDAVRLAEESAPPALAERLRRLAAGVGAPSDLVSAGADRARLLAESDRIVTETLSSPAVLANPRVPSRADVEQLVATLAGGPGSTAPRREAS